MYWPLQYIIKKWIDWSLFNYNMKYECLQVIKKLLASEVPKNNIVV